MTSGWKVLAGWGAWLCVLAAILLIFTPAGIEIALIGGVAVAMVLLGAVVLAGERRGARPRPERADAVAMPTMSVASVALAVGIAVFVVGWEFGAWMVGIGAGCIVFAAGGLIREHRAQRL